MKKFTYWKDFEYKEVWVALGGWDEQDYICVTKLWDCDMEENKKYIHSRLVELIKERDKDLAPNEFRITMGLRALVTLGKQASRFERPVLVTL